MYENKTILLVEDDAITAIYESNLLKKNNFKVITAINGKKAVEIVKSGIMIDLILMDINLGNGIDGTEVAEIILKDHDIPVIFLSNHTEPDIVERTEKITSYGYVVKNSGETVLIISIKMAFRLHDARLELKKREESIRNIFDKLPLGVHQYRMGSDKKLIFEGFNPAADKLLGLNNKKFIGKPIEEVFPNLIQTEVPERYREACEKGISWKTDQITYQDKQINGAFEVHAFQTEPGRMVAVFNDITQRKITENELRESEKKFRAFVETTNEWIWSINSEGRHTYCNPALKTILGYDIEEFLGSDTFKYIHKEDIIKVKEMLEKKIKEKEGWSGLVIRWRHKDGSYRYLESNAVPLFDLLGVLKGYRGADRDITERKLMEDSLKEKDEIFNSFMKYSPIYVFFKDEKIRSIQLSKNYEKMIGKPMNELLGKTMDDLFPSDIAKKMIEDDKRILREGKPLEIIEEFGGRVYSTLKFPIIREGKGSLLAGFTIDITDQKKIEEENKKNLNLMYNIIDSSADYIYVKNMELRTILCNETFAKALGKKPSDLYGKTDIENGWDPELVKGNPEKGIKGFEQDDISALNGNIIHIPCEPGNVNNKIYYFDTIKLPLKDENKNIIGLLGISRDITERKKVEDALQISETRFQTIFEQGPLGMALSDNSYRFVQANDAFSSMMGYEKEELINMTFRDITHPDNLGIDIKQIEKLDKGEINVYKTEKKYIRKDKKIVWGALFVSTLCNNKGEILYHLVMIEDITNRKKAEEELHKRDQELKTIVDNTPDMIIRFDKDCRHTFANKAVIKETGLQPEDFIGKTFRELKTVSPENIEFSEKMIKQVFETEKETVFETYIPRKNIINYYLSKGVPEFDEKGLVSSALFIHRNITERKKMEEELKKSLDEKVALLHEIQHRVKNSFNLITSIVGLELERMDSKKTFQALENIRNRINSLTNLYDMLYRTGEIEKIRLDLYLEDMINSIKKAFTTESEEIKFLVKFIEITIDIKQAVSIGLIMNELLTNSLKYAFKGRKNGIIKVDLEQLNDNVILQVSDNGAGLPDNFDINKLESLGLLLVKMLTEQIRGNLKILKGRGLKIQISFPL